MDMYLQKRIKKNLMRTRFFGKHIRSGDSIENRMAHRTYRDDYTYQKQFLYKIESE